MDAGAQTEDWIKPLRDSETVATPLTIAVYLGCWRMTGAGLVNGIDEEAMTGALLGAIAASLPWCAVAYGGPQGQQCAWRRFKKGGHAEDSESFTGGDFALLVRLPEKKVRLAIFQAKKAKNRKAPYIDVHHLSSQGGKRYEPQFMRLLKNGWKTSGAKRKKDKVVAGLHWVHYIAYSADGILTLPVSCLEDVHEYYRAASDSSIGSAPVALGSRPTRPLHSVISDGCNERIRSPSGWLETTEDDAKILLKRSILLQDIIEIDESPTTPKPDLIPEGNLVSVLATGDLPDAYCEHPGAAPKTATPPGKHTP